VLLPLEPPRPFARGNDRFHGIISRKHQGGLGSDDLPQPVLQEFLDAVAVGDVVVPIARVYGFDQIVEAHAAMEAGDAAGKLVVTT
jgi:NADPH:quinone reductase-like Zn-dependent oxidoreductase